ncbi:MAG: substrate-binding domain-containing protein [Spirochaetales bacterium]|nr:substrate-binding domain-containing protein [Spirochaetales bacterium]
MNNITIGIATESSWEIDSGYLAEMLSGIQEACDKQGVNLIRITCGFFAHSPHDPYEIQRNILVSNVNPDYLDGLIISATTGHFLDQESRTMLKHLLHKVPTVGIGPVPGIPSVVIDNKQAVKTAMNHLIEHHGYRNIALIRGPQNSEESADRYTAYLSALKEHDIPFRPELVAQGSFFVPSGIEAVREFLDDRKIPIDAIMAANDEMALGAIDELNRRNIIIPYDMAIVGFDDIHQARHIVPPLTTIRQPLKEMGTTAVRMLLEDIAGHKSDNNTVLQAELKIRHSCGCNEMLNESMPQEILSETGPILSIQTRHREEIIDDLKNLNLNSGRPGEDSWEEEFCDIFVSAVADPDAGRFHSRIDTLTRKLIAANTHPGILNKAVSTMRNWFIPRLDSTQEKALLETLLHQTREYISLQSQNAFALNIFRQNREVIVLHRIGNAFISTFDIPRLMDLMAEMLPLLGITGCYLSLYETPEFWEFPDPPPTWSRLILAFNEQGRIDIGKGGIRYKTGELLPAAAFTQAQKKSLTVESLFFRSHQIGFVIFEGGSHRRLIYEVLRAKIASALEGALILASHKESETELKLHKDHLEELVALRTAYLKDELAACTARHEQHGKPRTEDQQDPR